jgi:CheY-like chemotaxis protein
MGPQAMTDIVILVVKDNPDHRELALLALREHCDSARIATTADGVAVVIFPRLPIILSLRKNDPLIFHWERSGIIL